MKKLLLTSIVASLALTGLTSTALADACSPVENIAGSTPINLNIPTVMNENSIMNRTGAQTFSLRTHKGTGQRVCVNVDGVTECHIDTDLFIHSIIKCQDMNGVPVISGNITNTLGITYDINQQASSLTPNGNGYKLHFQTNDLIPITVDAYLAAQ